MNKFFLKEGRLLDHSNLTIMSFIYFENLKIITGMFHISIMNNLLIKINSYH